MVLMLCHDLRLLCGLMNNVAEVLEQVRLTSFNAQFRLFSEDFVYKLSGIDVSSFSSGTPRNRSPRG